jgi:hypothetical protein
MLTELLASLVLTLHLLIAGFITSGLLLIPIGAWRGWRWIRHRRIRAIHAGLMYFVALEALLGITCPLTILEYAMRDGAPPEYFLAAVFQKILYWDLPPSVFLISYLASAAWVVLLWWQVPPERTNSN